LTDIEGERLKGAIRASSVYLETPELYTDAGDLIDDLIGVDLTPPLSADALKSKHLAAIVAALDTLGDGTVGVKGGRYGADYSQTRDRDALIAEALGTLYAAPFFGVLEDGSSGSYAARTMNEVTCCAFCLSWPCNCIQRPTGGGWAAC